MGCKGSKQYKERLASIWWHIMWPRRCQDMNICDFRTSDFTFVILFLFSDHKQCQIRSDDNILGVYCPVLIEHITTHSPGSESRVTSFCCCCCYKASVRVWPIHVCLFTVLLFYLINLSFFYCYSVVLLFSLSFFFYFLATSVTACLTSQSYEHRLLPSGNVCRDADSQSAHKEPQCPLCFDSELTLKSDTGIGSNTILILCNRE